MIGTKVLNRLWSEQLMFPGVVLVGLVVIVIGCAILILRDTLRSRNPGVLARSVTCPSCRYSLQGLLEARCPECGSDLPAYDPATGSVPIAKSRSAFAAILAWTTLLVIVVAFIAPIFFEQRRYYSNQPSVEYVVRNDVLLTPRGADHPCIDIVRIEATYFDGSSWTETIATASDASGHFSRIRVTDELDRTDISRWLAAIPSDRVNGTLGGTTSATAGSKPCSTLDAADVLEALLRARDAERIDERKLRVSRVDEYATIRFGLARHITRIVKPTVLVAALVLIWAAGAWQIARRVGKGSRQIKLSGEAIKPPRFAETDGR